jgi:transposase
LAERVELRRQTAPLVDEFFTWAEATAAKLSAKTSLAGASRYAMNRQEALSRFLTDGRLEVDNNIAENAMRGIAIGRKITSSPAPTQAVTAPPPSTPSSRQQN